MFIPDRRVSERSIGLDLIRAIAVILVPAVHFFLHTNYYDEPLVGSSMTIQTFLRMTFMMCVPLFLMLTGYLQSNKELKRGYYKKLLPIIVVYFIYATITVITRIVYLKEQKSVMGWIAAIFDFSAQGYAWYINMYIGLFILIPFLNILYKSIQSKKGKQLLLVSLLFLTAMPELFRGIFPDYWISIYPITYYFIGSYIREYKPKLRKLYGTVILISIIIVEVLIELIYANGGPFIGRVGYIASILITAHAAIFFLLLYDIRIKEHFVINGITFISILSLDIYLASYVTDMIVYRTFREFYWGTQAEAILYFIPVVFATFALATSIAFIRYKLIRVR